MSYDKNLASRISELLKGINGITQKKMFGGLCFLHNGNMLCGIVKEKLVARAGPDVYVSLLKNKYTTRMDFTGKPLKGMLYILPEGIKTRASLKKWIDKCLSFVTTLPSKKKEKK